MSNTFYDERRYTDDGSDVQVTETRAERVPDPDHRTGLEAARSRFGGVDVPASFAGMLVALSSTLILAGLASAAIGAIAFQTGVTGNEEELSLGALIAAGVVIFLAFLFGGWAAGRMARYNGALNGFMVAVWFIVLLVVLAVLGVVAGDAYDLFGDLQVARASLPNWFSADETTTGAIISSIAYALVMVLGAILGGAWGTRMHRQADREIASSTDADADAIVHRRTVVEQGDGR
jgi:MFS family permease